MNSKMNFQFQLESPSLSGIIVGPEQLRNDSQSSRLTWVADEKLTEVVYFRKRERPSFLMLENQLPLQRSSLLKISTESIRVSETVLSETSFESNSTQVERVRTSETLSNSVEVDENRMRKVSKKGKRRHRISKKKTKSNPTVQETITDSSAETETVERIDNFSYVITLLQMLIDQNEKDCCSDVVETNDDYPLDELFASELNFEFVNRSTIKSAVAQSSLKYVFHRLPAYSKRPALNLLEYVIHILGIQVRTERDYLDWVNYLLFEEPNFNIHEVTKNLKALKQLLETFHQFSMCEATSQASPAIQPSENATSTLRLPKYRREISGSSCVNDKSKSRYTNFKSGRKMKKLHFLDKSFKRLPHGKYQGISTQKSEELVLQESALDNGDQMILQSSSIELQNQIQQIQNIDIKEEKIQVLWEQTDDFLCNDREETNGSTSFLDNSNDISRMKEEQKNKTDSFSSGQIKNSLTQKTETVIPCQTFPKRVLITQESFKKISKPKQKPLFL